MRVLVVAAHPDDEVLGCGGAIAMHALRGDEVAVEIMAEGVTSRDPTRDAHQRQDELTDLRHAAQRANKVLGVKSLSMHGLPDNRLDSVPLLDVVKRVEAVVEEFKPQIVYTHSAGDLNVDHDVVHRAVLTACRPLPDSVVRTVLAFEIVSSSEWRADKSIAFWPNWFVDISATLHVKLQALGAYAGEMRPWPHARSLKNVESLAHWRGASIGVDAAEAFSLLRHFVKT